MYNYYTYLYGNCYHYGTVIYILLHTHLQIKFTQFHCVLSYLSRMWAMLLLLHVLVNYSCGRTDVKNSYSVLIFRWQDVQSGLAIPVMTKHELNDVLDLPNHPIILKFRKRNIKATFLAHSSTNLTINNHTVSLSDSMSEVGLYYYKIAAKLLSA